MTAKKKKLIIVHAVVAALLIALIAWIAWGNTALELNTYTITSDRLPGAYNGYRIAHVSDLHNAEMGKDNEKLLSMLRSAEPDIIAITGDMIDSRKQISEGYEDQSRFDIMQKVGMTKKEIRNSINSQMLTVFFAPLLMAGVHICFAFPFLWKILMLFNMNNMLLIIATMAVCFVIFGLFYALVYKITSNVYYNIVSGAKEA